MGTVIFIVITFFIIFQFANAYENLSLIWALRLQSISTSAKSLVIL